MKPDLPKVTYWSWLAESKDVVNHFNETHGDVQVCWTNAGSGGDEYSKLSTALQSGSGAPDVAQIEYEWLNSFGAEGGILDLTKYGADSYKNDFTAGSWRDASSGSAVYGIPIDVGPLGLYYRKDVLQKAGVKVPKTWDEFAAAAKKIKDSGTDVVPTNFPIGAGGINSLLTQAGPPQFRYDAASPTELGINVNDPASKKILGFWLDLIHQNLSGTDLWSSPELNSSLAAGKYAMLWGAAWYNGYPAAAAPKESGQWRVAPLPQWDANTRVEANWGGSTLAVTKQVSDPTLATKVAGELYSDQKALNLAVVKGSLFPANSSLVNSSAFQNRPFNFYGDQEIMKDVFVPAAQDYKGVQYAPFSKYYSDEMTRYITDAVNGKITASQALDSVQNSLEQYAKGQGFTLK